MKSVCKLVLVVFLFTFAAFADDGNMGNGGRSCPDGQTTCLVVNEPDTTSDDAKDSFLTIIENYLDSVFNYFETRE